MTRRMLPVVLSIAAALLVSPTYGEPFFADLRGVVNTAITDDGVANNGQGGWTDEGINDMFIYPPVATGRISRNGYQFEILAPATNNEKCVVMLRGANRATDKPQSVTVALPSVKGAFVYVLQHAAGQVSGQPKQYRVATYEVHYADGTAQDIALRDGIEIRQWWTGQWYDNSGAAAWPIFVGRNPYTMKWNQYVGLWAMQWQNPAPEKAITGLVFRSEAKAAPIIWAVTIANEDFYEPESRRKEYYVRPPGVPDGYFTTRLDLERQAIGAEAIRRKLLQGVRGVDVIRNDLLAVTVDGAIGGIGPGDGAGLIEQWQKPETFTLSSETDPGFANGQQPTAVGRQSRESWRGDIGPFPANTLFEHVFYLKLPTALKSGHRYRIHTGGVPAPLTAECSLAYDERTTPTPALKVNQAAYSSRARARYAYLGWWAGDLGKVDYSDCKTFEVAEESSGKVVMRGDIRLRQADDSASGEAVREMDLADLKTDGRYIIRVAGLGCSAPFALGKTGLRGLYADTMRAFFHQRCGQELAAPWTTFRRPACHLMAYESGYLVDGGHVPKGAEATKLFRGGYHDAGDDDVFTYHLRATAQTLVAFEQYRDVLKDGDLNIPESTNGIPDVLDEAGWALSFYVDNQQSDGGVPLGRGNDQDAIRDWERNHHSRPPFGVFPPTVMSSEEFAAVASLYARLIREYDSKKADQLVTAASHAHQWAKDHPSDPKRDEGERLFRAWAASELYAATGDDRYNAEVQELHRNGAFTQVPWRLAGLVPACEWAYVTCHRPQVDPTVQAALTKHLLRSADNVVSNTGSRAYRMGHDGRSALGWGNGNGGGCYADVCLRAWWLTGDQRYLDAASLNADFQLGANPLSKTFVSGIGPRHPLQPEINECLYTGPHRTGETVRGITVYGLASGQPPGYPRDVPLYRRWRDIGTGAEVCNEFTITETIGASAMLYTALYAIESR